MRILAVTLVMPCFCSCFATSATSAQRTKVIPPEEFDKPYEGMLEVIRVKTSEEVRKWCPRVSFTGAPIACSHVWPERGGCRIVIADDDVIKATGWTPEIVM